jgi:hypothetical protein
MPELELLLFNFFCVNISMNLKIATDLEQKKMKNFHNHYQLVNRYYVVQICIVSKSDSI